jgi:MFS family permease
VTDKIDSFPPRAVPSGLILTVGFAVLFVSGGTRVVFSLMLKPMAEELGWGRALVSLVGTTFMAISAFGQPFVGGLIDRYSPLWIVTAGLFLSSIGIALMSVVTSVWHALIVYGVIMPWVLRLHLSLLLGSWSAVRSLSVEALLPVRPCRELPSDNS